MSENRIINCAQFSKPDLLLFIESMETLTRLEQLKKVEENKERAMQLMQTMNFFDQPFTPGCGFTLPFMNEPEEETVGGYLEHKPLFCKPATFHHNTLSGRSISFNCLPTSLWNANEMQTNVHESLANVNQEHNDSPKVSAQKKSAMSFGACVLKYCKKCFSKKEKK